MPSCMQWFAVCAHLRCHRVCVSFVDGTRFAKADFQFELIGNMMSESKLNPGDIRVIVMEDHDKLCDAVNRCISQAEGMHCVGSFVTATDTLRAIPDLSPNIVLLDLTMPDVGGLAVLKQLRQDWSQLRAIVFSGHTDVDYVRRSFELGAMGYVFKGDIDELIDAIRVVAGGEYFLSPYFEDVEQLSGLSERPR